MTEWFAEAAAISRSGRFTPFLAGVEIETSLKQKYFLKVTRTAESVRPIGLRFSKYSFVTEVTAGNYVGTGYGEAESKLVAFQKSVAEAVERTIYQVAKVSGVRTLSSNGWAAHVSQKHASASALEELLERDAVLVHWLTKSPFNEITEDSWPTWLRTWTRSELCKADRFKHLRILKSHLGHIPTVTTILRDGDGFGVVSHSAGARFDRAVARALAETCRIAQIVMQSTDQSPATSTLVQPEDHAYFYAREQRLPEWIFGQKSKWQTAASKWRMEWSKFDPRSVESTFHQIVSHPLVVGYATSPVVQNLYFGRSDQAMLKAQLNLKRLQKLHLGYSNPMPHFIP